MLQDKERPQHVCCVFEICTPHNIGVTTTRFTDGRESVHHSKTDFAISVFGVPPQHRCGCEATDHATHTRELFLAVVSELQATPETLVGQGECDTTAADQRIHRRSGG